MTQSSLAWGATVIGLSGWSSRSPRSYAGQEPVHLGLRSGTWTMVWEWVRKAPSAEIAMRQEHPPVLGDPVRDERGVERLLGGVHPDEQPAEVADDQGVVVLHAERARVVEGAVAHQCTPSARAAAG